MTELPCDGHLPTSPAGETQGPTRPTGITETPSTPDLLLLQPRSWF